MSSSTNRRRPTPKLIVNAFGAGRSEVSIGGISTKKLNYSLKTLQPLSEFDVNSKALTFIQAGITSGNGGDSRRTTINLGVGRCLLVEGDMAIAGVNVFTDYQTKSSHINALLLTSNSERG
jgi:hypothetical protein